MCIFNEQNWPKYLTWLTLRGAMNLRDISDIAHAQPLSIASLWLIPMLFIKSLQPYKEFMYISNQFKHVKKVYIHWCWLKIYMLEEVLYIL